MEYGEQNPFVQYTAWAFDGSYPFFAEGTAPTREEAIRMLVLMHLKHGTSMEGIEVYTALQPEQHLAAKVYQQLILDGATELQARNAASTAQTLCGEAQEALHNQKDEMEIPMRDWIKHDEDLWQPIAQRTISEFLQTNYLQGSTPTGLQP